REVIKNDRMLLDHYTRMDRHEPRAVDPDKRLSDMDLEVNLGLAPDDVIAEAQRCMSCGYCFDCEKCWMYCQDSAIDKAMEKGALYIFKLQNCTGCKKCAEVCPCGFIEMA
ncbi:MAG: 4Fe-4S binding protein, partial [Planctomycetota bacterium]